MGTVDPVGGQHDTVRSGRAGHHGTGRRVRGEEIHGKWDAVCDLMIRGGDRTEDPAEASPGDGACPVWMQLENSKK